MGENKRTTIIIINHSGGRVIPWNGHKAGQGAGEARPNNEAPDDDGQPEQSRGDSDAPGH